jgi:hypothetical protein
MERTQTCVLRSRASKTRNVHDEEHLIAELTEVDLAPVDTCHLKVVDRCHGSNLPASCTINRQWAKM